MRSKSRQILSAIVLFLFAGCAAQGQGVGRTPQYRPVSSTPPPTYTSTAPVNPPMASTSTPRRASTRAARPPTPDEDSGSSLKDGAPAPSKPSLTLAGGDAAREHTELLLTQVERKLGSINRTKLNGNDQNTYDQANDFASSARKALTEHDNVVASGLAEKASALAGRLTIAGASH